METLLPLMSFAFVTSVTPGPNNILLTASGIRFGFKNTVPHILGIQFGIATQLVLCASGLGMILVTLPVVNLVLKSVGTVYLVYLAWNLRRIQIDDDNGLRDRPFTFFQAVMFQFINPKTWIMTLTAGTLFIPAMGSQWISIALLCCVFSLIATPSSGSWAVIGAVVRKYLMDPVWQRRFSWLMVALTLYTSIAIWIT